ncbi:hypothetical protein INR75_03915 [Zunongwangia sp. SCSIO 43204]|uniref:Uncharacterized protein n=1 Tax=Zunongwangia mangrovi TaxID=1334022 RepID=A0A1I1DJS7_9FLAO|nr:hypothetical protein [Zunongwangia sp. SCSIO 43204]UAB85182.1 hypothetical protein INR75_03915 [Zunongwangia sp. SCSIO 43204]SFB74622.1 hypothetical protein SAMN04487907_101396 [Zunongwangia mangrovi]|tara:strand:+ start:397 stop:570 length:174 start_codon:yes stop_codon:yes gene_type:complete
MFFQQPELPKDQPATETQQYGFELSDFLSENFWYLLIFIVVVALVIFDHYRRKKQRK